MMYLTTDPEAHGHILAPAAIYVCVYFKEDNMTTYKLWPLFPNFSIFNAFAL